MSIAEEQQRPGDLLRSIETLKGASLRGASVIKAYHVRRLAPLMEHKLWMWEMTPDSVLEGTVMVSEEAITPDEVEDRLKDTMDCPTGQAVDLVIVYLVLGHPPMRPDVGFIKLVSHVAITFHAYSFLDLIMVVRSSIFTSKPSICCYQRTVGGE
jgi:hypothetical protein